MGRTGVFITLSIVLERMRYEGVVDMFQTVKTLRTQRPAMVQTEVCGPEGGTQVSSLHPQLHLQLAHMCLFTLQLCGITVLRGMQGEGRGASCVHLVTPSPLPEL